MKRIFGVDYQASLQSWASGPVDPGIVAVSFAAVFIRCAQANAMPVLAIAAWRLVFACAVLLPYAWTTCRAELF